MTAALSRHQGKKFPTLKSLLQTETPKQTARDHFAIMEQFAERHNARLEGAR